MVYVQDIYGRPLMPTTRHGKVRRLLKSKKATVVNLCPFTIRLLYDTTGYKQEITLGVDTGTKHVGLSATTKSKELYASEVILRSDVVDLLSTRRELRKIRRYRLRYRKPRFMNRIKSKKRGWIAPSIRQKIDSHIRIIGFVYSILPVSKLIIEVAQFDTQNVKMTFGYITKYNRINHGIEKSHVSDAFVISRNFDSERLGYYYKRKLVRRHNRQIHKMKAPKGGNKRMNQSPFKVFGFRLFDKVMFQGKERFIYARRLRGIFNIRDINGENKKDISYKKLEYVSHGLISIVAG